MLTDRDYGVHECRREGYGDHPVFRDPENFVAHFCQTHPPCRPDSWITRIEFD